MIGYDEDKHEFYLIASNEPSKRYLCYNPEMDDLLIYVEHKMYFGKTPVYMGFEINKDGANTWANFEKPVPFEHILILEDNYNEH
jgi:hypothetical protein